VTGYPGPDTGFRMTKAVVHVICAGVSLVVGAGGGLYWLVPALISVFISAAVKAGRSG
jgi:hypothetical protein